MSHGGTARIAKVREGRGGQGRQPVACRAGCLLGVWSCQTLPATNPPVATTLPLEQACGDENLAKLCGLIAADESRHEAAYTRTMDAIFKA